jgi:pyruvate decarboxylase
MPLSMYRRMAAEVTAEAIVLDDGKTATSEIDRVLNLMLEQSRPVYIGVPTDIAYAPVSDEGLKTALTTALPPNDKSLEEKVVSMIRSKIEAATNPVIVVDGSE